MIWYPPKSGLPADVTDVTFQYTIGFEYVDEVGRRQVANSTAADVTLSFLLDGGGDSNYYYGEDGEDA